MDQERDRLGPTVATLLSARAALDLDTVTLCFLVTLAHEHQGGVRATFDEDLLADRFEQVCRLEQPDAANFRARANSAIERLREQRLLARVDGAGLVRSGDFALTALGAAIGAHFLAEQALTHTSLSVLMTSLRVALNTILQATRTAQGDGWEREVVAPLRATVSDLIGGIERRQRGLDAEQDGVRGEIAGLLSREWTLAIQRCEILLDSTASTLTELYEVTLRESDHLRLLLEEVDEAGAEADMGRVGDAVDEVAEQLDRVRAWGAARRAAWQEYYQYVHRYLRTVVRLDPDRAVSERLRAQISGWSDRPFALVNCRSRRFRSLRAIQVARPDARVSRPREDRRVVLQVAAPMDRRHLLEAAVAAALRDGCRTLSEVLGRVLDDVEPARRYWAAGYVTHLMGRRAERVRPADHPFVPVPGQQGLHVQEFTAGGPD